MRGLTSHVLFDDEGLDGHHGSVSEGALSRGAGQDSRGVCLDWQVDVVGRELTSIRLLPGLGAPLTLGGLHSQSFGLAWLGRWDGRVVVVEFSVVSVEKGVEVPADPGLVSGFAAIFVGCAFGLVLWEGGISAPVLWTLLDS